MKEPIIPQKTDKQIEEEIDRILTGKDRSPRAIMLRNAARTIGLQPGMTKELVRFNFIQEYKKKYGLLQTGKTTIAKIQKESLEEIEQANNGKKVTTSL